MKKCIFGLQINIEVFCNLMLSFWVCVGRHEEKSMFLMSLQYLRKKSEILSMQIKIKVSYNLISVLWASKFPWKVILSLIGMIKHSQSTQSIKFAISQKRI